MSANYKNWVPNGMFMSKGEAKILGLSGSSLLVGKK